MSKRCHSRPHMRSGIASLALISALASACMFATRVGAARLEVPMYVERVLAGDELVAAMGAVFPVVAGSEYLRADCVVGPRLGAQQTSISTDDLTLWSGSARVHAYAVGVSTGTGWRVTDCTEAYKTTLSVNNADPFPFSVFFRIPSATPVGGVSFAAAVEGSPGTRCSIPRYDLFASNDPALVGGPHTTTSSAQLELSSGTAGLAVAALTGELPLEGGVVQPFTPGVGHTIFGKVKMGGYAFESTDPADPLLMVYDAFGGSYAYCAGSGRITGSGGGVLSLGVGPRP